MKKQTVLLFLALSVIGMNSYAAAPTTQASGITITNKTATSATISWTNGNGAKRVVFVENPSGTARAPYDNTTYTASADWNTKGTQLPDSYYYCVYNGAGNTVTITNLAPNSTYAVRISEYNGDSGTEQYLTDISSVTGNPTTFTTPEMPVAPTAQASSIVISNKTATSATISWTNGNGAKRVVFVENPSGTARAPYNNTSYTASVDWSSKGTQLPNSNYYCVYNDAGNTVTITNLVPNSTYAVRISEYNGDAGTEQYLTDISSVNDNPITFTTLTATNIDDTENNTNTVSVSPNPTTGRIMVTAAKLSGGKMSITVRDLQGNAVHQSMTQNTSKDIDLTSMPSGIYIVLIEIGGETTTHKVIKYE
jgi:hypothetical protein